LALSTLVFGLENEGSLAVFRGSSAESNYELFTGASGSDGIAGPDDLESSGEIVDSNMAYLVFFHDGFE
jgi:hypothetical protein